MKRVFTTICMLTWLAVPSISNACSVCMGDAEAPMTRGMIAGVGLLLGLIISVLAVFGAFIVYLNRRASNTHRPPQALEAV